MRGSYRTVSNAIGGKTGWKSDLLACEVAPVLDVGDGKCVSGLWVRHVEAGIGTKCMRERKGTVEYAIEGQVLRGSSPVFEAPENLRPAVGVDPSSLASDIITVDEF